MLYAHNNNYHVFNTFLSFHTHMTLMTPIMTGFDLSDYVKSAHHHDVPPLYDLYAVSQVLPPVLS